MLFFVCTSHWVDLSVLERYSPGLPTILLDAYGNEWARFEHEKREPIPLSKLPRHLIEAFISAEDGNFYHHNGISIKSIIRSLCVNLYYGKKVQGASTITQQLAKLLFFNLKKTYSRKIKEQLYALIIEQHCTKEHILYVYLNHIYFGCGLYGVEAACQAFWGISAQDVSIAQAATLAGIIRAPQYFCPLLCPRASEKRRDMVLALMHKRKSITDEQYEYAKHESLCVHDKRATVPFASHFKEELRLYLERVLGKAALYKGGYTVATTLHPNTQNILEQEFSKQIIHLRSQCKKLIDGGGICLDVHTGAIKALVGGYESQSFNRVFHAKRQLGSIFKPIIYAAAIEKGMHFTGVVIDEPIQVLQDGVIWSPQNYDSQFQGPITRAYALSRSNNIVTIKTLLDTGMNRVIDMAKRCHLEADFKPYPSLALGCIDETLLRATAMISIFAHDGMYVEPYMIEWIKDADGKTVFRHSPAPERIMSSRVAGCVAKVMMLSLQRAKKWFSHSWFEGEALSKTGTTNDSRTCWYIGATPSMSTGIYIGCDDNQSMGKNLFPVHTAFPIWLGVQRAAPSHLKQFTFDSSLEKVTIHERTGLRCSRNDDEAIEIFC